MLPPWIQRMMPTQQIKDNPLPGVNPAFVEGASLDFGVLGDRLGPVKQ